MTVVVVHWNQPRRCVETVGHLGEQAPVDSVIVVDNGSDPGTVPRLRRELPDDVRIVARALWVLAEIFFAAGATKVMPGVNGIADVMHSLDEAEPLRSHPFKPSDLVSGGNHAFCTTRMHGDPSRGVVDEDGLCHDLDNLYIADTGIFPQCPSVNPMFTGMALAHRQAEKLVSRL